MIRKMTNFYKLTQSNVRYKRKSSAENENIHLVQFEPKTF